MRVALSGIARSQAVDGDVGEAQVERALDVQLVEFLAAARIEHQRAGLAAHAQELGFGHAALAAVRAASAETRR